MHLCFIDESGHPPKRHATNLRPYFVIAAVIMHEAQWHGIADELARLKRHKAFRIAGEIKWRFFGEQNNDRNNSVAHLSNLERNTFRQLFFEILIKRKSVKIVACVTSVAAAYAHSYCVEPEDLYEYTYKVVSERFQYFLQDVSRTVGDKQLGIIVADHRGKGQDDLQRAVSARNCGRRVGLMRFVLEDARKGCQADHAAGAGTSHERRRAFHAATSLELSRRTAAVR